MYFPFTLALGYFVGIRIADKISGSTDRDNSKVIIWRLIIVGAYAAMVAHMFAVNLSSFNELPRWLVKTILILVIPFYDALRFHSFENRLVVNLRNLVLAPLAEEIVFRGPAFGYVGSSLAFSLAHGHTLLYDSSEWPYIFAQIGITFLFGLYAYHIYVKAGSVLTCTVVHGLCNYIGPPDIFSIWRSYTRIFLQILGIAIAMLL